MFWKSLQILAISQISLDPQNPTSWLCGISKFFSRNVPKIYISLNPKYPTSCGAMYPHNLKIYTRFHISQNPQYPTSCRCGVFRCSPKLHKSLYILKSSISFIQGVVFSENIQILAISQISLDPQNPTSWLCGVSNLFYRNVLRIDISLNPQYP